MWGTERPPDQQLISKGIVEVSYCWLGRISWELLFCNRLILVSKPAMKREKVELRTQADVEQHECESSVSTYSAAASFKEENSTWGNSPLCPSKHFIYSQCEFTQIFM